jgi:hypothetical protein
LSAEGDVIRGQPRRPAIVDFGMRDVQITGEMSREAAKHNPPAAQLCGRALDHSPSPIHVGDDEDQRDHDDRHDDQHAGHPRCDPDRPWHQKTCPNPM